MWRTLGVVLAIPVLLAGYVVAPYQHAHDAELIHAHFAPHDADGHHHDDNSQHDDDGQSQQGGDSHTISVVDSFVFPPAAAPANQSPIELTRALIEPLARQSWIAADTARPRTHDPPAITSISLRAPPSSRHS